MAIQNLPPLPRDGNGIAIQTKLAVVALGRLVSASISSSTTRNLTTGTTLIQCYAAAKDVYLKWGATAVTSSNFDEVIPAGQYIDLAVPVDPTTNLKFTTIRLIEAAATATITIIEK